MEKIMKFIKDEDGLELTEYAVMGALIVIALLAAVQMLTGAIGTAFTRIAGVVTQAAN